MPRRRRNRCQVAICQWLWVWAMDPSFRSATAVTTTTAAAAPPVAPTPWCSRMTVLKERLGLVQNAGRG